MPTIPDAMIALEATEILLQDILNEETLEFFTGETGPLPDQAGRRLLAIGRLLYDRPRDCLQISLWELLAAMYPDVWRNGASPESLFRPGAWALSESVTMETTWDEFEAAVRRMCEPISSSALHIVLSSD
jgi:hypothetical protein